MEPINYVIGIDLGTTFSVGCIYQEEKSTKFREFDDNGVTTIPSSVWIPTQPRTPIAVGRAAMSKGKTSRKNLIYDAKRMIGRNWNEPTFQSFKQYWEFGVSQGDSLPSQSDGHDIKIQAEVAGEIQYFKPYEISALVLAHIKNTGEKILNTKINQAVITVPAYFGSSERRATKLAAEMAGLEVLRILNEPTAAALAYSNELEINQEITALIFDLGGGTFDVTVLKMTNDGEKYCDIIATDGDAAFGGRDIERNLEQFLIEQCRQRHSDESADNKKFRAKLKLSLEEIKKELSSVTDYEISIDINDDTTFSYTLTRATFEKINEKEFKKCNIVLERLFEKAKNKVRLEDIQEVILVGGSTYIPKIQEIVTNFTKKKPHSKIPPELVVARGAALLASLIGNNNNNNNNNKSSVTFKDIISHDIGVEEDGKNMSTIVQRFSALPCKKSKKYTTKYSGQKQIKVKVFEGNDTLTANNTPLASSELEVPESLGEAPFEIELKVNLDQIIEVSVTFPQETRSTQFKCSTTPNFINLGSDVIRQKKDWINTLLKDGLVPSKGPTTSGGNSNSSQTNMKISGLDKKGEDQQVRGGSEVEKAIKKLQDMLNRARGNSLIPQGEVKTLDEWVRNNGSRATLDEVREKTDRLLTVAGDWRVVLENI